MKYSFFAFWIICILLIFANLAAAQNPKENPAPEKKLETTGQWFLAFQRGKVTGADPTDAFVLKRGYITFSKELNQKFAVRYTQDIITDQEGEDAGNIETRLKYCYLKYTPFESGFFAKSFLEAGMVHRPYLDFEERVNGYRLQGTMFLERYKVINSADFGITWIGLLGGEMENPQAHGITSGYPGKYGSFAIGVFNGGGYHALEYNRGKTVEGRLTLRPLPDKLPGLQVTYAYAGGKGNTISAPRFENHCGFISLESKRVRSGIQYTKGFGNMAGTLITAAGSASKIEGISAFGEFFVLPARLSCFLRYDTFEVLSAMEKKERLIGGITWAFYKKNRILIDTDILQKGGKKESVTEVVIELIF